MPGLTTAFAQGVAASRPAAATSNAGYVYFATDTGILSQSTGSSWTTIGPAVTLDSLTAKGDLLTRTSSAYARLGVGSDAQVLTADSTQSTGVKWATPASGGMTDPMSTRGDLIVRGAGGTTRLALGSSGQYLKSDGTDAAWAAPTVQVLGDTLLGSAAASFTFSSIAGTFRHLQVVLCGRGDTANTGVFAQLTFNGDSTSGHYDWNQFYDSGATPSGFESDSTTFIRLGTLAAASAGASVGDGVDAMIYDYASTTFHKALRANNAHQSGPGTNTIYPALMAGFWRSTAAITSITITASAGNFATGTRCTLYGL